MSKALQSKIIKEAYASVGKLSRKEALFIKEIADPTYQWCLTIKQANWLYDIGEKKLDMVFDRPAAPEPVIDYKARACA